MKLRTDFVTNSSSSSFILARKEELSEKLKETIVAFVQQNMLGEKFLDPSSTEEQILKVFDEEYIENEEEQKEIRKALKEGKAVYGGWISFEESEYLYGNLFERLWKMLNEADENAFTAIDDDLSY